MSSPDQPRPIRARHRFFFMLAAFNVLTVCVSVYVTHEITERYGETEAANAAWSKVVEEAAAMARAAGDIDRAGNDVFESGDVAASRAIVGRASEQFGALARAAGRSLDGRRPDKRAETIAQQLAQLESLGRTMAGLDESIFQDLEKKDPAAAGRHMARLDRAYQQLNRSTFDLVHAISGVMDENWGRQRRLAGWIRVSEFVLAGATLCMVAGALVYGIQATRQYEAFVEEREAAARALREAHDLLELRVVERTAQLQAANEMLRQEVLDRTQAEAALSASTTERLRLLDQLLTAQEQERKRIARELHDGVSQTLASLSFRIQALTLQLSGDAASVKRLAELQKLSGQAFDEVRRLVQGLRPMVLDDLGLAAAVERLVSDCNQDQGQVVTLECNLGARRFEPNVELAVYRLLQEALHNAQRHSGAARIDVSLVASDNVLRAQVRDDGRGFDAQAVARHDGRHLGLPSMRERVGGLGGQLRIDSQPGQGTLVEAEIPIMKDAYVEAAHPDR